MQIVEMPIGQLKPYENNPRDNDSAVGAVAASIAEFGFKVPIIIDKNNVIVAGHTRLKAAEKLGLAMVPVIRADDLSDAQIRAFRLADNKTAELAAWDFERLEEELDEIDGIDMTSFGFEDLEKELEDFGSDDSHLKDQEEPKEKEGKTCTCPACGFTFEIL